MLLPDANAVERAWQLALERNDIKPHSHTIQTGDFMIAEEDSFIRMEEYPIPYDYERYFSEGPIDAFVYQIHTIAEWLGVCSNALNKFLPLRGEYVKVYLTEPKIHKEYYRTTRIFSPDSDISPQCYHQYLA